MDERRSAKPEREQMARRRAAAAGDRAVAVDPKPAGTARVGLERVSWLLLIYRVPSDPSRLRATIWRRLKSLGAVYLANSVAALPASPATERALRSLRNEIGEMGGSAQLLAAQALVGDADVIAAYNAARDEEYGEFLSRSRDLLAEIDKETAAAKFNYAELEENEDDLVKLRGWLEKIRARDVLNSALGKQAGEVLDACEQALHGFAEQVYAARDDLGPT